MSRKKTATAKDPLLRRIQVKIRQLPDPTALFLLLLATTLALRLYKPELLRSWVARLIVPPLFALCVAAAALWRPTKAKYATPDNRTTSPPGVLPSPANLVAIGAALRAKDAKIRDAEHELRSGQIRLEVLRKEIECRLPSHNTLAPTSPTAAVSSPPPDRPSSPIAPRSPSNPFMMSVATRSNSSALLTVRKTSSMHVQ